MSCGGVAETPARWVLADGQAHLLAGERPRSVLVTSCGHPLSWGVLAHERLPSRDLCVTCFSAYLLPEPVFYRTPAGHRLSGAPESAPGGQPVPDAADIALLDNDQQFGRGGEPHGLTGDPWIDAYLTFQRTWPDGTAASELTALSNECRCGLPARCPQPCPLTHRERFRSGGAMLRAQISLFRWVEQIAEDPEPAVLVSPLHQPGRVVGGGRHTLYVRFDGKEQLVGVPSTLLRLLPAEPDGCQRVAPFVRVIEGAGDDC